MLLENSETTTHARSLPIRYPGHPLKFTDSQFTFRSRLIVILTIKKHWARHWQLCFHLRRVVQSAFNSYSRCYHLFTNTTFPPNTSPCNPCWSIRTTRRPLAQPIRKTAFAQNSGWKLIITSQWKKILFRFFFSRFVPKCYTHYWIWEDSDFRKWRSKSLKRTLKLVFL